MLKLGNSTVIARMPKLGPLIGCAKAASDGRRLARLWAKADESYSAAPLAAMTVEWHKGEPVSGSLKFWRVRAAEFADKQGLVQHRHYFALADLELPPKTPQTVVRMAFLHSWHSEKVEDQLQFRRPLAFHDARPEAQNELLRLDFSELFGLSSETAGKLLATPVEDEKAVHDHFAGELFKNMARELRERDDIGRAAIPKSLSRRFRNVPAISDCEIELSTPRESGEVALRFAATCCRHPGVQFDRALADRALGALAQRVQTDEAPDFVLMLGDQIYADATAGVLDVGGQFERYAARYDSAFGSKQFRELSRRVPMYMLADDHEIRDDWPNDPQSWGPDKQWDDAANWGWQLCFAHQYWHGPRGLEIKVPRTSPWPGLCYSFEHGGFPFFAFDMRFEREPGGAHVVLQAQLEEFQKWLDAVLQFERATPACSCMPKFVLGSTVFSPGLKQFENSPAHADNWQGFAAQRAQFARLIAESGAQNVVLVSGDYHCAAVGSIEFRGSDRDIVQGYSIIAPPLYAPFPFANVREPEVLKSERFPASGELAVCTSRSCDTQGYALISVPRPQGIPRKPHDWQIEVQFYEDFWQPCEKIKATGTLANGSAELKLWF